MGTKFLHERILHEGKKIGDGIFKLDGFINHQIDPYLMKQVGVEFVRRFSDLNINKIITIEASGIAPAIMVGYLMELPVVFVKKHKPSTISDSYTTTVTSFTKQCEYTVVISKEYLTAGDRVLFIDDFLAYGNASKCVMELCQQAGAVIEGMGFIVEKAFQNGRKSLYESGMTRIESLAIIDSLDNGILLREEPNL